MACDSLPESTPGSVVTLFVSDWFMILYSCISLSGKAFSAALPSIASMGNTWAAFAIARRRREIKICRVFRISPSLKKCSDLQCRLLGFALHTRIEDSNGTWCELSVEIFLSSLATRLRARQWAFLSDQSMFQPRWSFMGLPAHKMPKQHQSRIEVFSGLEKRSRSVGICWGPWIFSFSPGVSYTVDSSIHSTASAAPGGISRIFKGRRERTRSNRNQIPSSQVVEGMQSHACFSPIQSSLWRYIAYPERA